MYNESDPTEFLAPLVAMRNRKPPTGEFSLPTHQDLLIGCQSQLFTPVLDTYRETVKDLLLLNAVERGETALRVTHRGLVLPGIAGQDIDELKVAARKRAAGLGKRGTLTAFASLPLHDTLIGAAEAMLDELALAARQWTSVTNYLAAGLVASESVPHLQALIPDCLSPAFSEWLERGGHEAVIHDPPMSETLLSIVNGAHPGRDAIAERYLLNTLVQ